MDCRPVRQKQRKHEPHPARLRPDAGKPRLRSHARLFRHHRDRRYDRRATPDQRPDSQCDVEFHRSDRHDRPRRCQHRGGLQIEQAAGCRSRPRIPRYRDGAVRTDGELSARPELSDAHQQQRLHRQLCQRRRGGRHQDHEMLLAAAAAGVERAGAGIRGVRQLVLLDSRPDLAEPLLHARRLLGRTSTTVRPDCNRSATSPSTATPSRTARSSIAWTMPASTGAYSPATVFQSRWRSAA